jgi:hypothetical protein
LGASIASSRTKTPVLNRLGSQPGMMAQAGAQAFTPVLFGLILSGLMSLVVSAIAAFRAAGPVANFLNL